MSTRGMQSLRAVDTPEVAKVAELDGGDEMFPLRKIPQVAEMLGCHPDTLHALCDRGLIAYVLLPSGKGEGAAESEGRRRRIRNDHLAGVLNAWTHWAKSA